MIVDKKGRLMGRYASLTDITQYSKMTTHLEQTAEIDPLTGIADRKAYEQQQLDMDSQKKLPLSVIIGDVNRLKQVNDSLGHQQGDELLCRVADVLRRVCPIRGLATRIGGDEFALLIPRFGGGEAERLVEEVKCLLAKLEGPLAPSIALCTAINNRQEENLQELIDDADRNMSRQKEYDRRSRYRNNQAS